jgi:hypothetical protein
MSGKNAPEVAETIQDVVTALLFSKKSATFTYVFAGVKLQAKPLRIGVAGQGNLPSYLRPEVMTSATATSSRRGFARLRSPDAGRGKGRAPSGVFADSPPFLFLFGIFASALRLRPTWGSFPWKGGGGIRFSRFLVSLFDSDRANRKENTQQKINSKQTARRETRQNPSDLKVQNHAEGNKNARTEV